MCAIVPSSGSTTTSSSPPTATSSTRGRRPARGLRKDFGAAASLLERAVGAAAPRTRSTSRSSSSSATSLYESGRACRGRPRAESLVGALRHAGNRVGELAGGSRPRTSSGSRAGGRDRRGSTRSSPRRCRSSRPPATTTRSTRRTSRAGWWRSSARRATRRLVAWELAARRARAAGIPDELVGWRALARLVRHDSRHRGARRGWTRTSLGDGRDDWLRASRGVALAMLGRFERARAILAAPGRAGGARRRPPARRAHRHRVRARSSSSPGIPPTAAALGAEGCRLLEELEAAVVPVDRCCTPRRGALRARPARRSGRVGRTGGQGRRPRRSVHPAPLAAGTCEDPRAARRARGGGASRATRLSRSTESTQDLNGRATRTPTLAEVLLLAERSDEAAAALEQALERYERKENLASAERTRARLDELVGAAPSRPSSRPAPRPRAPSGRSRPAG